LKPGQALALDEIHDEERLASCALTSWMATMFGCCKLAAAAASARNRCARSLPDCSPNKSIFTATMRPRLFCRGLVNNAHAATGDFFEQS